MEWDWSHTHMCWIKKNEKDIWAAEVHLEDQGVPAPHQPGFQCQEEKSLKLLAVKPSGQCG